jgi:outer membrane protein OmpA-like peptidoglycan-associated protein
MSAQKSLNSLNFILFCALLLLVAGFFGCSKRMVPAPPTALPSPETANDSIVFTSNGSLYLTDLGGNRLHRLPNGGGSDWFPAASPDSSQLAFWSSAGGSYELWVLNLFSENRRQLTDFNERSLPAELQNFGVHNAPSWSPDGKRIAFAFGGKIWLIESTGFNLETLVAEGENYAPAWSPDGSELAFVSVRGRTRNLYLRRFEADEDWPLTNFPAGQQVGGPAWSPDGQWLAFTVSTDESSDVWTVRGDGTQLRRITLDRASHSPAWSPDGKRLALTSGRQDPSRWEIWVMNPDGSGAFAVSRTGGTSPAWLRRSAAAPHAQRPAAALPAAPLAALPTAVRPPVPEATPAPVRIAKAVPATRVPTAVPEPTARPTARPAPPTAVPIRPAAQPTVRPAAAAAAPVRQAAPPTLVPTKVPAKPTAKATARPTAAAKEDYSQYESFADQDKGVLPKLDITQDRQTNRVLFAPQIEFYFAKDLIKPASFPVLKQLAEELNKYPESPLVVRGEIAGGAKLFGSLLKSLSRARANSVLRHLIVTEKIKHINVNAMGEGDEFPELGKRQNDIPLLLVIVK